MPTSLPSNTEWVCTEIDHGHCTVTNGNITISVLSDFSGNMTSEAGDFFEFKDLRDFIDAGKLLEYALTEYYGGYK